MTTADTSLTPPAPTKTARGCKWLLGCEQAGASLRQGLSSSLEVRTGDVFKWYLVEAIRDAGRVIGWRLTQEITGYENEHEVIEYIVDTSFGPVPDRDWTCSCPDYSYRSGKRQKAGQCKSCRHILFLAAALKAAGIAS